MPLTEEDKREIRLMIFGELELINLTVNERINRNEIDQGVKENADIIYNLIKDVINRRHQVVYERLG